MQWWRITTVVVRALNIGGELLRVSGAKLGQIEPFLRAKAERLLNNGAPRPKLSKGEQHPGQYCHLRRNAGAKQRAPTRTKPGLNSNWQALKKEIEKPPHAPSIFQG